MPRKRKKLESKLATALVPSLAAPYDHSTHTALLDADGPGGAGGASGAQAITESTHNALVEFRTRKKTDTGNKHHGCAPQPTRWHTQVVPIYRV
eukprot:scaffold85421_cov75-Phaeocystis_antarctica.AAC.2